jgi:hypothetical protein
MYRKVRGRVYTCDMCGETVTLVAEPHGYGQSYYEFPRGWSGSYRKSGVCLCPRCSEAYKRALGDVDAQGADVDE